MRLFLDRADAYGFDYETNVVKNWRERRARTIQIGDRNEQYVIDLLAFADGNSQRLIDAQGDFGQRVKLCSGFEAVGKVLTPSLCSNRALKVGNNLDFEYHVSRWSFGWRIWNLYGCDIAEKLLLAGLVGFYEKGYFALDDLSAKYLKKRMNKEHQTSFDLETPLTEEQIDYCALDTRIPLAIRIAQGYELKKAGLERAAQIEMDCIGSFADIHMNGIYVDRAKWMALVNKQRETHVKNVQTLDTYFIPVVGTKAAPLDNLEELERVWRDLSVESGPELMVKEAIKGTKDKELKETLRAERKKLEEERKAKRKAASEAFVAARQKVSKYKKDCDDWEGEAAINYGSNPQIREALLKMKGITAAKLPDTNDDTLKKLAGVPVIDALREYRTSKKALDNYGTAWARTYDELDEDGKGGHIDPVDGCIHSRFNQMGAATGRTSSTAPNIQNLPKEAEVRACFVARPGYRIITLDMSGAELRIIADYSNAPSWVEAFNKGWDVHSVSTEILYPVKWPEIRLPDCAYFTKDHKKCKCPQHEKLRGGTKSTNFLLCYGGGPTKLAQEIGEDVTYAKELMGNHEKAFPDVWAFLKRSGQLAVMKLEARSMSGRRRLFKRPTWDDAKIKAKEDLGREPTTKEISKKLGGMSAAIEREGKNMPIQGSNADFIKLAMGCALKKDGTGYLWHTLEKYRARLVNMVHDELVVECPEETAEECKAEMSAAMIEASGEFLKHVKMDTEGHVDLMWRK